MDSIVCISQTNIGTCNQSVFFFFSIAHNFTVSRKLFPFKSVATKHSNGRHFQLDNTNGRHFTQFRLIRWFCQNLIQIRYFHTFFHIHSNFSNSDEQVHCLAYQYQLAIKVESDFRPHIYVHFIGHRMKCIVCKIDLKAIRHLQQLSLIHICFAKCIYTNWFLFEIKLKLASSGQNPLNKFSHEMHFCFIIFAIISMVSSLQAASTTADGPLLK